MIRVKNWSKYQSYKDRKPPWIRFHRSILDDFKFQSMSAESRALLPMIWLLACEDEDPTSGLVRVSYDEITFRLRIRPEVFTECLRELQVAGFIECIESVTEPYQDRNQTVSPETETETDNIKNNAPSRYRFEGKVVRLTHEDFAKWETAFPSLDIMAECQSYDDWVQGQPPEEQKGWFHRLSGTLRKHHDSKPKPVPQRKNPVGLDLAAWGVGTGNA